MESQTANGRAKPVGSFDLHGSSPRQNRLVVHRVSRERYLELLVSNLRLDRLPSRDGLYRLFNAANNEMYEVSESELYPPIQLDGIGTP